MVSSGQHDSPGQETVRVEPRNRDQVPGKRAKGFGGLGGESLYQALYHQRRATENDYAVVCALPEVPALLGALSE